MAELLEKQISAQNPLVVTSSNELMRRITSLVEVIKLLKEDDRIEKLTENLNRDFSTAEIIQTLIMLTKPESGYEDIIKKDTVKSIIPHLISYVEEKKEDGKLAEAEANLLDYLKIDTNHTYRKYEKHSDNNFSRLQMTTMAIITFISILGGMYIEDKNNIMQEYFEKKSPIAKLTKPDEEIKQKPSDIHEIIRNAKNKYLDPRNNFRKPK